jgi:hypothetical protein
MSKAKLKAAKASSFPFSKDASSSPRLLSKSESPPEKWPDCTDSGCRQGKIDERFKETYDKLIEIRNQLDRLTMTQAWSLRETDLFMWQRKLDRIDDSRRDGNFFDAEGRPADLHAQRVSERLVLRG